MHLDQEHEGSIKKLIGRFGFLYPKNEGFGPVYFLTNIRWAICQLIKLTGGMKRTGSV